MNLSAKVFIFLQKCFQDGSLHVSISSIWIATTTTTTYHNQLGGEVSALSTDVGDVPAGLEESLAVATSLGARHPYALLRLVRLQRFILHQFNF